MDDDEPWVAIADRVARKQAARFYLDLDDATQAARVGAWQAWHRWRPGGMERDRFVGQKAFFAIVELLRTAGGYGSEVGRDAYLTGARCNTFPLESWSAAGATRSHASAVDAACDLRAALGAIPAREAAIVTLVDLDGLTLPEAAALLGVSKSRIFQIRSRALNRMRPLLAA